MANAQPFRRSISRTGWTLGAVGRACAMASGEGSSLLPSELGFGLAFYLSAHVVAGPVLGLEAPEWR